MENKLLKVIAINHKQNNNLGKATMSGIYLHGAVSKNAGYDIVDCINPEDFAIRTYKDINSINTYNALEIKDGKYPCSVYGYNHNCTAYIWHRLMGSNIVPCGLIVDDTDAMSVAYAEELITERRQFF